MYGSRILSIALVAATVTVLVAGYSKQTRRCGRSDIAHEASCEREGKLVAELARRCRRVIESDTIRGTPWAARLRDRWDGSIHQLIDRGPAPAVTTEKSDIRVCLDGASSVDAMVFVCLHELSHIAVESHGHTPEFWQCMAAMIEAATRLGVYTHRDNSHVCGTSLGPVPKPAQK